MNGWSFRMSEKRFKSMEAFSLTMSISNTLRPKIQFSRIYLSRSKLESTWPSLDKVDQASLQSPSLLSISIEFKAETFFSAFKTQTSLTLSI